MKKLLTILFTLLVYHGGATSYHPGKGSQGTRFAGAVCLNLPDPYKNYYSGYPINVCAMRANCKKHKKFKPMLGDLAEIRMKKKDGSAWRWTCVVLDTGPWGCVHKNSGKWVNASPRSKYKGECPAEYKWKKTVDMVYPNNPNSGYPGGGKATVRVFHVGGGDSNSGWSKRRQAVMDLITGKKVVFKHAKGNWKKTFKF